MKIVKRTKKYFYVELGEKDVEDVFSSSDLIRVERDDIDKNYTLSDKVKCDGDYEEVDYPMNWVVKDGWEYKFVIPDNVDDILDEREGA